jgi:sirohydrochlorin ferrochelatase
VTRAILLVDHGSRVDAANEVLERIAATLRRRLPDRLVAVAHMELAEPNLADALAHCTAAGVREVVVCPYFLGPGRHTTGDIPRLVEEARAAHPELRVAIAEPLGFDERLVDVVLARVEAALV